MKLLPGRSLGNATMTVHTLLCKPLLFQTPRTVTISALSIET